MGGGLDNEVLSVGANVEADPGEVGQIELEQRFDGVDMEIGLRGSVCGHQAVSHGDVEELVAAAEDGIPSAACGDLGFGAGFKWTT